MLLSATLLILLLQMTGSSLVVNIITDHVHQTLDERYLSVTYDQSCLSYVPKFGPFDFNSVRLRTLLRGLSPAYLRFGGTTTDSTVFSEASPSEFLTTGTKPALYTITKKDWDNFVNFTRATGIRFLYEFSIQHRYGTQLDPSNIIETLEYLTSKGYGENIDFEMGNEPNDFGGHPNWAVLSGRQITQDYRILQNVLAKYPAFNSSILVGPDTGTVEEIYKIFVNESGLKISAATWHHYYFRGTTANYMEYLNASHFDELRPIIQASLDAVKVGPNPELAVWLGETSDAYHGGTANVSDRFISGFLWMDKLGLSATMGLKAVLRQTFFGGNYPLVGEDNYPNPDYWLSYIYKKLVGLKVLQTDLSDTTLRYNGVADVPRYLRVYAHCTQPSEKYKAGAVTIYALNVNQTTSGLFYTTGALSHQAIEQYLLTPMGPDGVLSRYSLINGKELQLVDDRTFPVLTPVELPPGSPVILPPLSYGFFVLPDANITACSA